MPELGVRQNDTGKEGTQGRRQPYHGHQNGRGHHHQQRKCCVHFAQTGVVDIAEDGAGQEGPRQNNHDHRPQCHKCHAPTGQAINKADNGMMFVAMFGRSTQH